MRAAAGVDAISVQVIMRHHQYIGHLARYPHERLERQMLGAWLQPESAQSRIGRGNPRMAMREQYWQRVCEVMRHTEHAEDSWHEKWVEVAGHKKQWRHAMLKAVAQAQAEARSDEWLNRHSVENEALAREVREAPAIEDSGGQKQCTRCLAWFAREG